MSSTEKFQMASSMGLDSGALDSGLSSPELHSFVLILN